MRFIDEVKIEVRAGNGGAGASSFRREKYIPFGGPDGGDGGRGAHVIFTASRDRNTLQELYLRKRIIAENGTKGKGSNCHGRMGKDIEVIVPIGTVIRNEQGELLADLTEDGATAIIAKGGIGGQGNARFATSTNQAPRYSQPGLPGEAGICHLELKMMADVGLVGLPNAGKSTFISRVSNARPKIADYPFTTLAPSLGQVFMDDGDGFVIADIPGLIEGAHEGKGLGHRFLRHVERTRLLLHLVDVVHPEGISVEAQVREIEGELIGYGETIAKKKRFLLLNKMDAVDEELRASIMEDAKQYNLPIYPISAVSGEGITQLLRDVYGEVVAIREYEIAHAAEIEKPVTTRLGIPEKVEIDDEFDDETY
ncbi:MAG: GTPase ObgE [Zetaproteobacteria bacterium CG2_30_46_52]|nr:MAG: GTPase ObgE [Zetaproteobacteria bacterium CG2_30_46_52]